MQYKLCSDQICSRKHPEFLHNTICQAKKQPLQGLLFDGSLISGSCHLTIGYYFISVKAAYAADFPLLLLILADIT